MKKQKRESDAKDRFPATLAKAVLEEVEAAKAASPEGRRYAEEQRRAGLGPVVVHDPDADFDEVRRRIPADLGMGETMKAAKKAASAAIDTAVGRAVKARAEGEALDRVVKAILTPRVQRIAALEKMLREAEAANHRQSVGSLSAQITHAKLAKAHEEADLTLARLGMTSSADAQAAALAAASGPAIRRVQGAGSVAGSSDPRRALQAVLSGEYTRETPPEGAVLPSQLRQLRKDLDEALEGKDMQRAAELSYRLTKAQLVDLHRREGR